MIYLDNIIFSLQKSGGISAVWYEHLKRLLKDEMANDKLKIIEYDSAEDNIFRQELQINDSIVHKKSSKFLKIRRYINPVITSLSESFIFHSSYYRTCGNKESINITTVHDFTYEYFTKGFPKIVHCLQKYQSIRNSDLIICISQNTKNDLLKFLPDVDENKVRVVYNGVSDDYIQIQDHKITHSEEEPFVLFVGARGGYKNFALAVEALAETHFKLVVVGAPLSDFEIKHLESKLGNKRYKYKGRVSNLELNRLYNSAFCLLYPSSYEGFGIPVIEAQKAGCPVIAANCSSIPEIVGDKSLLINCFSVAEIVKKLIILKTHPSIREELIELGIENSKRFSWDITYSNILKIYNEAQNMIK